MFTVDQLGTISVRGNPWRIDPVAGSGFTYQFRNFNKAEDHIDTIGASLVVNPSLNDMDLSLRWYDAIRMRDPEVDQWVRAKWTLITAELVNEYGEQLDLSGSNVLDRPVEFQEFSSVSGITYKLFHSYKITDIDQTDTGPLVRAYTQFRDWVAEDFPSFPPNPDVPGA